MAGSDAGDKAETEAAARRAAAAVEAVERFYHIGQGVRRDPAAIVDDGQPRIARIAAAGQRDAGARLVVAAGILDKIGDELGQELRADAFEAGSSVDVVGTTRGKGTAGVMKRHGFGGGNASHGAHRNHRKPGSIGGAATPGRVFRGHRMAGRMGGNTQTTQNLKIHAVDVEKGLLLVAGAVPGPKRGVVLVRTAVKGA